MPDTQPLVSVIIPTYNRAHTIGRAIRGVQEQTYGNLEIVVVDDGSTDDTQSILAEFGNEIRIVRQVNQGPAAARNRGIQESGGEIIAFQDSDDGWHPSKLARQVQLLQKVGPSVPCCFCNTEIETNTDLQPIPWALDSSIFPHETGIWTNPAEILATRCLFFNQSVAVRRSALEVVGGFNPELRYFEEWDLALKLAFLGPWAFIRDPLTYWTPDSAESISGSAIKDLSNLQKCRVRLLRDALHRLNGLGNSELGKTLARTLEINERRLRAIQMSQNRSHPKLLASLFLNFDHWRTILAEKSQSFPPLKTIPGN
jgi:glycosyltransferase involved in cell wall biosynthesis